MELDPATAATVATAAVALAGLVVSRIRNARLNARLESVLAPINSFAYLAAKYTVAKADGSFDAVDKENLATATIKFFGDLEAAGESITRP